MPLLNQDTAFTEVSRVFINLVSDIRLTGSQWETNPFLTRAKELNMPEQLQTGIVLKQAWGQRWDELHPQEASIIDRIDQMWVQKHDQLRSTLDPQQIVEEPKQESIQETDGLLDEIIALQPEITSGTYQEICNRRNLFIAQSMKTYLLGIGREVPHEITQYIESRQYPPSPEREN
jgi:hypothetical protein